MDTVEELLGLFQPISLDEMNKVVLLDRMDTKYIFHRGKLSDVLTKALSQYRILTINDKRFAAYETLYFDTEKYNLYLNHHNRKLNRHKVRIRTYLDSSTHFFEIKFKSNKGKTIKTRVPISSVPTKIEGEARRVLNEKTTIDPDSLVPKLQINFNRITLVDKAITERITIDTYLTYTINGQKHTFPHLVIAEVKHDKTSQSRFASLMLQMRIFPTRISKYCFGIANFIHSVKKNNFKYKIRYVSKLCKTNA